MKIVNNNTMCIDLYKLLFVLGRQFLLLFVIKTSITCSVNAQDSSNILKKTQFIVLSSNLNQSDNSFEMPKVAIKIPAINENSEAIIETKQVYDENYKELRVPQINQPKTNDDLRENNLKHPN